MKNVFVYIKNIKANDSIFWIYFILQYVIPLFLIYPFINEIWSSYGYSRRDFAAPFIFAILVLFVGISKSKFPKETKNALILFVPIIINFVVFALLYGFNNFILSLKVYGAITFCSTLTAFFLEYVISLLDIKKGSKKIKSLKDIIFSLLLVGSFIFFIKFFFSLLLHPELKSDSENLSFYVYLVIAFVLNVYVCIKYLFSD